MVTAATPVTSTRILLDLMIVLSLSATARDKTLDCRVGRKVPGCVLCNAASAGFLPVRAKTRMNGEAPAFIDDRYGAPARGVWPGAATCVMDRHGLGVLQRATASR